MDPENPLHFDSAVFTADNLVKQCAAKSDHFDRELNKATKDVNDLNLDCKTNVTHAQNNVKHETKRLEEASAKEREDLKATEEKIKSTLDGARDCVNKKIRKDVEELVKTFRVKVQSILNQLRKIESNLRQYISRLEKWISRAEQSVTDALERINNILKGVDEKDSVTQPYKIKHAVEQIKTAVTMLHGAGGDAGKEVREEVVNAQEQLKQLEEAVRYDLNHVKTQLLTKLAEYVQGYVTEVQKQVGLIKDGDSSKSDGLQGIKEKIVKNYAEGFQSEGAFEVTVKGWILKSLEMEMVNKCLEGYIKDSQNKDHLKLEYKTGGSSVDYKALNNKIRDLIMAKIKEKVSNFWEEPRNTIGVGSKDSIQGYTDYVKEVCQSFAKNLGEKLKEDNISHTNHVVGSIVETIKQVKEQSTAIFNSEPTNDYNLSFAIRYAMAALQSTAQEAAKTLEQFAITKGNATANLATNLDKALKVATDMDGAFDTALVKYGDSGYDKGIAFDPYGTAHKQTVQLTHNIHRTISDILKNEVGEDGTDKDVGKVKLDNFTLSFTNARHGGEDRTKKTALTNAIRKIQSEVENALTSITQFHGFASEDIQKVTDSLTELYRALKHEGEQAKLNLNDLKAKQINGQLDHLKTKLSDLQNFNLVGAIQDAEKFMKSLDSSLEPTIQLLGNHVRDEVASAEKTLITHARKQYVDAVKFLLEKFADRVTGELQSLPEQITKDLTIGHKGFMAKLHDHIMVRVERIKSINPDEFTIQDSPLSQASKTLKGALNLFIIKLQNQPAFKADFSQIRPSYNSLTNLLANLEKSKHFDDDFRQYLELLHNAVTAFKPSTYGEARSPSLLNALKKGFSSLASELQRAYVSTYSQQQIKWDDISQAEKEKYAKIALTLTPIVYQEFTELKDGLEKESWKTHKIYNSSNSNNSLHKLFFAYNGYDVGRPAESPYGELNHKKDFNGSNILAHLNNERHKLYSKITTPITVMSDSQIQSDEPPLTIEKENGVVRQLFDHLNKYFGVCHLNYIDKPRSPCSIYDMSLWLSGLPHNPVYEKLKQQIKTMFEVPSETDPSQKIVAPVKAYPQQFTDGEIHSALEHVTSHAYSLLTGVVGHGDAETFYACEFPSNSLSLYYPASGAECLDMLLDILRRMFPVLTFLHTQCSLRDKHGGWRDCYYGKDIKSSKLSCNHHVTDKATCQPMCQANTKPNCQPTSPLMSYLNDSLHGHLPHDVTSVGCKSSCNTCPKSTPGMPCLPPLGFRAFSNSTHTGRDLCELLGELVGTRGLLTKLHSLLTCLLNRPPQWFPDIFSFYYQVVRPWNLMSSRVKPLNVIQQAIADKITSTVGCDSSDAVSLLDSCRKMYDSPSHFLHDVNSGCDIGYLVGCGQSDCGYIMRPLNASAYSMFAPKFASSYLSCLLYACSNIYNFLDQLKNSFCDISCYDHQCGPCLNSAGCAKGKHGTKPCGCSSIVQCRGVSSVFYRYGLAYADAAGRSQIKCQDFCAALDKILQSQTLKNFLSAIDEFMFTVRKNFIWTLLGLWAFSFLYLLHITVVRLDVLRIRSHLRSPSSHRIAAQSLLAAARVKALANVKYFSP
ncbi:hypothetical protein, conserved [Babesia ovata]|uniref:C3H1-type domain-containing protein n=1 Tax=Babesia ovata TaxID=189622 RepID=A0A2H6KKF2_9APIC|nr:uncharacterized protein BOVATA_049660 [Babesia ovata]GBE63473.1 hypothetical protein, conserved [Babesia ovata]